MPFATGPWHVPPDLPDDPAVLCLVVLHHAERGLTHHAMRYKRHAWYFEDGSALSPTRRVMRWAYITDSLQRMSEIPPPDQLPAQSRLFVPFQITDHENVLLLSAFIAELKGDVERLRARLREAYETKPPKPDTAYIRQLEGRVKQVENERTQQVGSLEKRLNELRAKLQPQLKLQAQVERATMQLERQAELHASALAALSSKLDSAERQAERMKDELHTARSGAQAPPELRKELKQLRGLIKSMRHDHAMALAARDRQLDQLRTRLRATANGGTGHTPHGQGQDVPHATGRST